MRRLLNGCRHAITNAASTSNSYIFISDQVLDAAYQRFVRAILQPRRHGSHVPGPLEARRRRAAKKNMTILSHRGLDNDAEPSIWSRVRSLWPSQDMAEQRIVWSPPTARSWQPDIGSHNYDASEVILPETVSPDKPSPEVKLPDVAQLERIPAEAPSAKIGPIEAVAREEPPAAIVQLDSNNVDSAGPASTTTESTAELTLDSVRDQYNSARDQVQASREICHKLLEQALSKAEPVTKQITSSQMETVLAFIHSDMNCPEADNFTTALRSLRGHTASGELVGSLCASLRTLYQESGIRDGDLLPAFESILRIESRPGDTIGQNARTALVESAVGSVALRMASMSSPSRFLSSLLDAVWPYTGQQHQRSLVASTSELLLSSVSSQADSVPDANTRLAAFLAALPRSGPTVKTWQQVLTRTCMAIYTSKEAATRSAWVSLCDAATLLSPSSIYGRAIFLAGDQTLKPWIAYLAGKDSMYVAQIVLKFWLMPRSEPHDFSALQQGQDASKVMTEAIGLAAHTRHGVKAAKRFTTQQVEDVMELLFAMRLPPTAICACFHALTLGYSGNFPVKPAVDLITMMLQGGQVKSAQRVFQSLAGLELWHHPALLDAILLADARSEHQDPIWTFLNHAVDPTAGGQIRAEQQRMIEAAAERVSRTTQLRDRQVWRRLATIKRWLTRNAMAPTRVFARAMVQAGVTRYLVKGRRVSSMRLRHIVGQVKRIEGAGPADEIERLAQRWRLENARAAFRSGSGDEDVHRSGQAVPWKGRPRYTGSVRWTGEGGQ